jgi:hypothetical protein
MRILDLRTATTGAGDLHIAIGRNPGVPSSVVDTERTSPAHEVSVSFVGPMVIIATWMGTYPA